MIVADTNLIAYLFIQGDRTTQAELVLKGDAEWTSPYLWRSEFRNVLAFYIRKGLLSLANSQLIIKQAEMLMLGREYEVSSDKVLNLVASSSLSAYDCEYVALAQDLGVPLVTSDKKLLRAFPATAVAIEAFAP
ncbi:MAG TPA: type II toxin-antitoxin system VapC family toxin [Blastocatellia bacterium]|nr:type II toxin-antitoxin system VapC family toxin [Blastocatellia bacterium]